MNRDTEANRDMAEAIGANLKAARVSQKVSREKLSEHLNVSRMTVYRWEVKGFDVPASQLLQTCRFLGVSVEEILGSDIPRQNRSEANQPTRS